MKQLFINDIYKLKKLNLKIALEANFFSINMQKISSLLIIIS